MHSPRRSDVICRYERSRNNIYVHFVRSSFTMLHKRQSASEHQVRYAKVNILFTHGYGMNACGIKVSAVAIFEKCVSGFNQIDFIRSNDALRIHNLWFFEKEEIRLG